MPEEKIASLKNYSQIILGLRPQMVSWATENSDKNWVLKAKIELIENLGGEKYFYLNLRGEKITAQIKSDRNFVLGSEIEIFLDLNQAYYFDPVTEKRIV